MVRGTAPRLRNQAWLGLPIGPLSSSLLGLPYRILNKSHKKELRRGLYGYSRVYRDCRV